MSPGGRPLLHPIPQRAVSDELGGREQCAHLAVDPARGVVDRLWAADAELFAAPQVRELAREGRAAAQRVPEGTRDLVGVHLEIHAYGAGGSRQLVSGDPAPATATQIQLVDPDVIEVPDRLEAVPTAPLEHGPPLGIREVSGRPVHDRVTVATQRRAGQAV